MCEGGITLPSPKTLWVSETHREPVTPISQSPIDVATFERPVRGYRRHQSLVPRAKDSDDQLRAIPTGPIRADNVENCIVERLTVAMDVALREIDPSVIRPLALAFLAPAPRSPDIALEWP